MSLIENLKKRGLKDVTNPRKWGVYFRFILNKLFPYRFIREKHMVAYCEQVVYRMSLCRQCVKNGSCVHCGCKSPELFLDGKNVCSADNWYEMLSPEQWEEFKENTQIQLGVQFRSNV